MQHFSGVFSFSKPISDVTGIAPQKQTFCRFFVQTVGWAIV
jgi:hypothetical protein